MTQSYWNTWVVSSQNSLWMNVLISNQFWNLDLKNSYSGSAHHLKCIKCLELETLSALHHAHCTPKDRINSNKRWGTQCNTSFIGNCRLSTDFLLTCLDCSSQLYRKVVTGSLHRKQNIFLKLKSSQLLNF